MSGLLKLFSSVLGQSKDKENVVKLSGQDLLMEATGEDNEAWLRHLSTRNPTHRKAGSSINEEYQMWLIARAKTRSAQDTRAVNQQVA